MTMQIEDFPVEIVRSDKRVRTVSASIRDGKIIVLAPSYISQVQLDKIVVQLRHKLIRKHKRANGQNGDLDLQILAEALNREFFEGKLRWQSIRWVSNQNTRFGSCTPAEGTLRISDRLKTTPLWVIKYVVVHELAHLLEGNHGARFWALANRYPLTERARGYLMALGLEEDGS